jgi:hypothetical protein
MRKFTSLLLVLSLALLPQLALGQGKKGTANLQPTTPEDYTALSRMSQVFGKVVSFDPVGGTLLLRVEYQVPDPNYKPKAPVNNIKPPRFNPNQGRPKNNNNFRPNKNNRNKPNNQQSAQAMRQYQQKMMQMQKQQMQYYQKMMQQMAKNQQANPGVKLITLAKEFHLPLAKEPLVARYTMTGEYDEKGNFKEPTPEELKKLKHPKLPGYLAKLTEVLPGQQINLYLGKADPKQQAAKVDLLNANPLAPAGPPANAPAVDGILIVTDVDLASMPQPKKKKN